MHRTGNNYIHKGYIASFFLRVKRMDKIEMRKEMMTVMIFNMREQLKHSPRATMKWIHAPVTDAHIKRYSAVLDELERRYS